VPGQSEAFTAMQIDIDPALAISFVINEHPAPSLHAAFSRSAS